MLGLVLSGMAVNEGSVARRFAAIAPFLDVGQRRVWLGVEAREVGQGGVSGVGRATGVSRPTVSGGIGGIDQSVEDGWWPPGRVRRAGGGRKAAADTDPGLVSALEALVDPATRGDPESPLLWTSKSTRELADRLAEEGHPASHGVV